MFLSNMTSIVLKSEDGFLLLKPLLFFRNVKHTKHNSTKLRSNLMMEGGNNPQGKKLQVMSTLEKDLSNMRGQKRGKRKY